MLDRLEIKLERAVRGGVALVGACDGRVAFGFTERTGGVSRAPYASLNLGTHVGDDPDAVTENRRRVLAALGCEDAIGRLIVPNQVHGDTVLTIREGSAVELADISAQAAEGADAIVCRAPGVPVMLCFADCVPVVLTCPGGFAVVHSGWKGTFAGIAGKAARELAAATGTSTAEIRVWIGPHIRGDEYQVSEELLGRFCERFPCIEPNPGRLLDLSAAIRFALVEAGVVPDAICDAGLSTIRDNDRFFSYRAEGGTCGRHAAVAVMR